MDAAVLGESSAHADVLLLKHQLSWAAVFVSESTPVGLFCVGTTAQLGFDLALVGNLVMGDSRFGRGCRLLNGNRSVINQWI